MVRGVCDNDPRTIGERRSDAVGAIAAGSFRLACQCGSKMCPAADAPSSSNVVIRVLADQSSVNAATGTAEASGASPPGTDRRRGRRTDTVAGAADPRRRQGPSDHHSQRRAGTALSTIGGVGRVRADTRPVLPRARLRRARRSLRHRPHPSLSDRPDPPPNIKCLCRTNHLMRTVWRMARPLGCP